MSEQMDGTCGRCGAGMQATHHPLCDTTLPDATVRAGIALCEAMAADELSGRRMMFVADQFHDSAMRRLNEEWDADDEPWTGFAQEDAASW